MAPPPSQAILIKFAQRNKALPDKLIFYRDGVSEGQFPDVVAKEIPLVRQAMRAVGENPTYAVGAFRCIYFVSK